MQKLQGAALDRAQLQGALLFGAQLQGASLVAAKLQGASLNQADLRGARPDGAKLQGAELQGADLRGASLDGAAVNAADFSSAFLWRTDWGKIDPAKLGAFRLKPATWNPAWRPKVGPVPWDAKAYAELRDLMIISTPNGLMRTEALKRIEVLDCGNPRAGLASCDPAAAPPPDVLDLQEKLERASADDAAYAKALATELLDLVCARDVNTIHILRGTIKSGRLSATGADASRLVDFIKSKDCPVSDSLTVDERAELLKIKQIAERYSAPPRHRRKESEPAVRPFRTPAFALGLNDGHIARRRKISMRSISDSANLRSKLANSTVPFQPLS